MTIRKPENIARARQLIALAKQRGRTAEFMEFVEGWCQVLTAVRELNAELESEESSEQARRHHVGTTRQA